MRMPDEGSVVAWCVEHFGEDGSQFMAVLGFDMPVADLPLYEDERIASMLATARSEARQGVGAYAQDVFIQGRAWPFDPEQIRAPAVILRGRRTRCLP
jgi:hypothetical protein